MATVGIRPVVLKGYHYGGKERTMYSYSNRQIMQVVRALPLRRRADILMRAVNELDESGSGSKEDVLANLLGCHLDNTTYSGYVSPKML